MMDKNQIIELLKTVKYPGYKKNIIDFGMFQDAVEADGILTINLRIISDDLEKLQIVRDEVSRVLSQNAYPNTKVIIQNTMPKVETGKIQSKASHNPMDGRVKFASAKYVVAVSSAKGGVGKSTIAANIALGLVQKGYKTGLLDLDVFGPSAPMLFDINEAPLVQDEHTIYPARKYGLEIMSFGFFIEKDSPVIWRGPLVMKLVDQFLSDVRWSELDFLILDLPPGTGDVQLTLSQKIFITGAILVTTPQDLALLDVSRGANMFQKVEVPVLGIVENMSYFICDQCQALHHLFSRGGGKKESERLKVPLWGELPLSPLVMQQSDKGEPIVSAKPDTKEAQAFMRLVEKLIDTVATG
ncbi:MAG TPA: ATP-binding protein [Candidatus Marinimicrobia bacterium]|nr:ATP-binding protein [Candidatus Neomarinimicrobiota bacterium]